MEKWWRFWEGWFIVRYLLACPCIHNEDLLICIYWFVISLLLIFGCMARRVFVYKWTLILSRVLLLIFKFIVPSSVKKLQLPSSISRRWTDNFYWELQHLSSGHSRIDASFQDWSGCKSLRVISGLDMLTPASRCKSWAYQDHRSVTYHSFDTDFNLAILT